MMICVSSQVSLYFTVSHWLKLSVQKAKFIAVLFRPLKDWLPYNIVTDYRNKNGPASTSADAEPLLFYFSSGFVKSNPSVNGLIGLMVEMACL